MSDIFRSWRATFTRRWHANFDLCHTDDPDGGHSARVALLMLHLKPDLSRDALIAALVHDLGEMATGDHSYDFKKEFPDIALRSAKLELLEVTEKQGLPFPALSVEEHKLLKICDGIDAWLWMVRHAPHLRHRHDWRRQAEDMLAAADGLGVQAALKQLLSDAVNWQKGG